LIENELTHNQIHKQEKSRNMLLEPGGGFGRKDEVDTISWLLGAAAGWGGNPSKPAIHLRFSSLNKDGKTAYTLVRKESPAQAAMGVCHQQSLILYLI
jgi:hypothetical protein